MVGTYSVYRESADRRPKHFMRRQVPFEGQMDWQLLLLQVLKSSWNSVCSIPVAVHRNPVHPLILMMLLTLVSFRAPLLCVGWSRAYHTVFCLLQEQTQS